MFLVMSIAEFLESQSSFTSMTQKQTHTTAKEWKKSKPNSKNYAFKKKKKDIERNWFLQDSTANKVKEKYDSLMV